MNRSLPPSPQHRLRTTAIPLLAPLLTLLHTPLAAHDLWLEPSTFRPAIDEKVAVTIRLGERFSGDSWPRIPPKIERFSLHHDGGERPVAGLMGDDPAGHFTPNAGGAYTLLYWNQPDFVQLGAEKFEAYLQERGLEGIAERRAREGETGSETGEYYSRCAKALLIADGGDPGAGVAPTGCDIDLVMTAGGPDQPPRFQLLFRGEPLAGALLIGLRKENTDGALTARTDARGEATFPPLAKGVWLFSAVHALREARNRAQWRSYWASLTFER